MKSFSQFLHNPTFRKGGLKESVLKEYLTPEQEEKYSRVPVRPEVNAMTDHFFGTDNDFVKEEIPNYNFDKSEVHKSIERHLGQEIEIDDYIKGHARDKYGRKVRIGALLNDSFRKAKNETEKANIQKLQNSFTSDNSRAGSKATTRPYMTIHRGTQVAGQTNGEVTSTHPQGHSWAGQSCKNIETGSNASYLADEIKAGTVVAFAHDHTGQEIYRATLQPHYEIVSEEPGQKKTGTRHIYVRNSEYGVKNQAFTRHVDEIAKRLSTPVQEGDEDKEFLIDNRVYNDLGMTRQHHPGLSEEALLKSAKEAAQRLDNSENPFVSDSKGSAQGKTEKFAKLVRRMTQNMGTSTEALTTLHKVSSGITNHISTDAKSDILSKIVGHPNVSPDIMKLEMRKVPRRKPGRLDFELGESPSNLFDIKAAAMQNPNADTEILRMGLDPEAHGIHYKPEQFDTSEHEVFKLDDFKSTLASRAIGADTQTSRLSREDIEKAARHPSADVSMMATQHPKADDEILDIAVERKHPGVYSDILDNPKLTDNHRMKMFEHLQKPEDFKIRWREGSYRHGYEKNMLDKLPRRIAGNIRSPENIERMYHSSLDKQDIVESILTNPNTPESVLRHAATEKNQPNEIRRRKLAVSHPKIPKDIIWNALDDTNSVISNAAASNISNDSDILNKMVRHPNPMIRFHATQHPNAEAEHFEYLLDSDESDLTKKAAIEGAVVRRKTPMSLKLKAFSPKNAQLLNSSGASIMLQKMTPEEKNSPEGHQIFRNAIKHAYGSVKVDASDLAPFKIHHEIMAEPTDEENPESTNERKRVALNSAYKAINNSNELSETDIKQQLEGHAKTIEMGTNDENEDVRGFAKYKIERLIHNSSPSQRRLLKPDHYQTIRNLAQKAGLEGQIGEEFNANQERSERLHKQS